MPQPFLFEAMIILAVGFLVLIVGCWHDISARQVRILNKLDYIAKNLIDTKHR